MICKFEPPRDKTNNMACALSEDSDQPGYSPSLIRVFAVRMKKAWVLSYLLSTQRRLWSDWAGAQTDLSFCWAQRSFCWFCHEAAHLLFELLHSVIHFFFSVAELLMGKGQPVQTLNGDGILTKLKTIWSFRERNPFTTKTEQRSKKKRKKERKAPVFKNTSISACV